MTMRGDAKFKRNLTCGLKNDLRNLVNFYTSSLKFENLHFDGLLLSSVYKVLHGKVPKSYVSWRWWVMQSLKKKLALGSKNDMWNLVNFNANNKKSVNLHFDVLLLSKVYYVWAKKRTEDLCHNPEEWCKTWRGTGLCFEKWYE